MKALVVDGYNAIYKIAHLKNLMSESLYNARKEITRLAKEYQRKRGGIKEAYVIFDGQDRYRVPPFIPASNQVFSRTGEGDREVVRMVRRLAEKYDVVVVTDDNFVRNNSRAYNATIIGVGEFFAFLTKGKKTNTKNPQKNKISPEEAKEINEELKEYWNI